MPTIDYETHKLSVGTFYEKDSWTGNGGNPPGQTEGYSFNAVTKASRIRRSWNRTPNYHFKRVNGLPLPVNSFFYQKSYGRFFLSGTRVVLSYNPYQGHLTERYSWIMVPGDWSDQYLIEDLMTDDEIIIKASMALKDKKTWDAQLFGAELNKTVSLVATTAKDVAKAMSHLKKAQFGKAMDVFFVPKNSKKYQRGLSNGFLAYRYGVLPAIQDAYDAIDAISTAATVKLDSALLSSVKVTIKKTAVKEVTIPFQVSPDMLGLYCSKSLSDSRRMRFRYRVSDPLMYSAARFGVTNPASTVYNLIPFSFVLDWFANVGDWISSLDAGVGLEFNDCYISRRREALLSQPSYVSSAYFNINASVQGSAYTLRVDRVPLSGLPTASPSGITWKPGLLTTASGSLPTVSGSRLASAIALLRQLT